MLTDEQLAAIRQRAAAQVFASGPTAPLLPAETIDAIAVMVHDQRLLLAEVDRLRGECDGSCGGGDGYHQPPPGVPTMTDTPLGHWVDAIDLLDAALTDISVFSVRHWVDAIVDTDSGARLFALAADGQRLRDILRRLVDEHDEDRTRPPSFVTMELARAALDGTPT